MAMQHGHADVHIGHAQPARNLFSSMHNQAIACCIVRPLHAVCLQECFVQQHCFMTDNGPVPVGALCCLATHCVLSGSLCVCLVQWQAQLPNCRSAAASFTCFFAVCLALQCTMFPALEGNPKKLSSWTAILMGQQVISHTLLVTSIAAEPHISMLDGSKICVSCYPAGVEQGKPQPPHMLRCAVNPVSPAVLETVVEDFLSVPNSAVRFTKRRLDPDSVQFLISKQDMKAWLQSVDVLSAEHAPLSTHNNFEQATTAQA